VPKNKLHEFGQFGEKVALNFLESKGYRILEQNYRCRLGEIDLVALDRKILVFIEIKTRHTKDYGSPQEAVTYRKQEQIIKVALHYVKGKTNYLKSLTKNMYPSVRFDVVAISPEGIELIRDAFSGLEKYTF